MNGATGLRLRRRKGLSRAMKNTLNALMFVVILLCSLIASSGTSCAEATVQIDDIGSVYDVYADNDGGFYILSGLDGMYRVTHIFSDSSVGQYTVKVDDEISCYAYCNNTFCFVENCTDESDGRNMPYLLVTYFDAIEEYSYKRAINNVNILTGKGFAIDNDRNLYLPLGNALELYSEKGLYIDTLCTDVNILSITVSPDSSEVYFSEYNKINILSDRSLRTFSISSDRVKVYDDGYFITDKGEAYRFTGDNVEEIGVYSSAGLGIADGYVIGMQGDTLTADSDTILYNEYSAPDNIISSLGTVALFEQTENGIRVTMIDSHDIDAAVKNTDNSDNISHSGDIYYKSSFYSFENGYATGIEPSTTIAEIKRNIDVNGYEISFYDRNGNLKKSGTVGTGAKIAFSADGKSAVYSIIIFGDLSGEGNINSSDMRLLTDNLLGEAELEGDCLSAADVTHDNQVDLRDLLAMKKHIDGGFRIEQRN